MARMVDISNWAPQQQAQPQQTGILMRGGQQVPMLQQQQQNPLGAAFMNMSNQSKNPQPAPGSFAAQFQLGKDYQNLGMGFQNAFSQSPQQVNPMAAFFMQNRQQSPQYNSFQNVMNYQNSLQQQQPAMGSIMGIGAQPQPQMQQGGGFLGRGIFGSLLNV